MSVYAGLPRKINPGLARLSAMVMMAALLAAAAYYWGTVNAQKEIVLLRASLARLNGERIELKLKAAEAKRLAAKSSRVENMDDFAAYLQTEVSAATGVTPVISNPSDGVFMVDTGQARLSSVLRFVEETARKRSIKTVSFGLSAVSEPDIVSARIELRPNLPAAVSR